MMSLGANFEYDKVFYWPHIYYSWRLTYTPGWMVHEWDTRLEDLSDYHYVGLFDSSRI